MSANQSPEEKPVQGDGFEYDCDGRENPDFVKRMLQRGAEGEKDKADGADAEGEK